MKTKIISLLLCVGLLFACNNTQKGAGIGAGGGAVLGGIIGAIAGNTAIGAVVGGAVGAGVGAVIGNRMDKAKKAAEQVQNAQVESVQDANGLQAVKVTFDLTKNGSMPADEVVQLYVRRIGSKVEWPTKELKAFDRISLGAGETKTVTLEIPVDDLRYWNVDTDSWTLEHGQLELLLGSASDDIRQKAETKI